MNTTIVYNLKRVTVFTYSQEVPREKFEQLQYYAPKQYTNNSRYKNVRLLKDDVTKKYYHETINVPYVEESSQDEYFVVTLNEKDRLDIVSNIYYDSPRYWWVIAYANYLLDPFDVPVGTTLRIPPLISLYKRGGVLSG